MNGRRIRLIMRKELLQLRRDPILVRALFLMPILQLIFFGYVVGADVTNLPTAVVDLDHSAVSRQIEARFAGSGYFAIRAHPVSETALRPLIDRNEIRVGIVIEEGTQARLDRGETVPLGIIVDGSDSQSASVGSSYAAQIVARLNADRREATGVSALAATAPGIDARVRVMFNPTLAGVNTMIPGLVAVIMMISLMAIMSQAVVRERESGTLEQMFVTPLRRSEYLIGKVAPYALLATAQMLVVAAVGLLWFRVPFHGNVFVVLTGLGLFLLTSIGLGLVVSLVSRTRQQAQQTVMFILLPTMILSGFIFPLESMPDAVRPLAYLLPMTYALDVVRSAAIKGSGFEALAVPLLALAGFAVLIFGGAVVATRRRLAE